MVWRSAREAAVFCERSLLRTTRNRGMLVSYIFQPLLYLLVFTRVFSSVSNSARFQALGFDSYLSFFLPGLLVMSVLGPSLASGLLMVGDIYTGMLDGFLRTPVRRSSILLGRLAADAVRMVVQSCTLVLVGLLFHAHVEGGLPAIVVMVAVVLLLGLGFACLSNVIGLRTQRIESTAALANLAIMPLTFASTIYMPRELMPGWLNVAVRFNPLTYVVEAGRALAVSGDLSVTVLKGFLVAGAMAVLLGAAATRAYQKVTA